MKIADKINYLQENHFSEWMRTRRDVFDLASDTQPMFCVCGRLATGLHESGCRKFQGKVDRSTVERLKHLFDKK